MTMGLTTVATGARLSQATAGASAATAGASSFDVSGFTQGLSQLAAGTFQASQAGRRSARRIRDVNVLEQETLRRRDQTLFDISRQTNRFTSTQRASAGAAGLERTGSALLVELEAQAESIVAQERVKKEADIELRSLKRQKRKIRQQEKDELTEGIINAVVGVILVAATGGAALGAVSAITSGISIGSSR